MNKLSVNIQSEIGELEAVIIHTPGAEIENMTPTNAHKALYSDILNVTIASKEHSQLSGVLSHVCKTYQITDLLLKVLQNNAAKQILINKICQHENQPAIIDTLLQLDNNELCRVLIEGLPLAKQKQTNEERFLLKPLYNLYFTRDASFSVDNNVIISKMAHSVRDRESLIMEAIFNSSGEFETQTVTPNFDSSNSLTVEGGDILIARDDIILVGNGTRTNAQGIDLIVSQRSKNKGKQHIIVQQLPSQPESFIHLDMVFTLLDYDKCMVFEPTILQSNNLKTIHITAENGKVISKEIVDNIPSVLKSLGMDLKPISCGGKDDLWKQEREQWHSGANFVCLGPGKVIGYSRNINTINEMNRNGFEIIRAEDVIQNRVNINNYSKYVITIDASELPRGGGGARCMTMPVSRKMVKW